MQIHYFHHSFLLTSIFTPPVFAPPEAEEYDHNKDISSSTFPVSADDSGKAAACRKHRNSQPLLPLWSFCKEHTGTKLRKREKHTGQKKKRMENREMCH